MKKLLLSLVALLATLGAWAAVTQPVTGVYVISGDVEGKRGNLAAVEGITAHPALSNITWNDNSGNYIGNSATPITNGEHWYVYQVGDKYVIYNLGLKKYLFNPKEGSKIDFSDTPYLWDILVNSSNGNFNSIWDATGTYLCFACGKNAANRNVHFNNQPGDGGSLHTFTAVDNGVNTYAEDIAVVVSKMNPTFTLTDIAGNEYTGTYSGIAGVDEPALTGVAGLTLSNQQWDGSNFTADITFPFPASKEVYISTFMGSVNPGTKKYYVDGSTVKYGPSASVADSKDKWIIEPSLNGTAFTFKIKNVGTDTYITTTATTTTSDGVTVSNEGTIFTIDADNRFKLPTTTANGQALYLSGASTQGSNKTLGAWTWNGDKGVHNGNCNYIYEPNLAYVLTDAAGNTFTGNIDASGNYPWLNYAGVTLTNPRFSESGMSATINFPFSVSSAEVANIVLMSIGGDQRKWSARKGLNDEYYIHILDDTPELGTWQWAIYPQFEGGVFKYKIMNVATGKYVYAKPENTGDQPQPQGWFDNTHQSYPVILNDEGTAFEIEMANSKPRFTYQSNYKKLYLSVNGSGSNDCPLGVWNDKHSYEDVTFPILSSYEITIGETGYTTLYSPIDGTISDGATAYAITQESLKDGYVSLTEMDDIAANKGVIVLGTPNSTYTFTAGVVTADWSANLLLGSSTNTYVAGDAYVLSAPNGVESVGLYKATLNKNANGASGGTHFKNNAGKAYLPASALTNSAEVRFLSFDFGGNETAIENVEAENENAKAVVYDLAGRRVKAAQKGLYIVNGKVVIK